MSSSHIFTCIRDVRTQSKILHLFPWRNGCILHPNSLGPWISDQAPSEIDSHIYALIQKLANEIDKIEATRLVSDDGALAFYKLFIPKDDSQPLISARSRAFIGRLVMAYQLLDTLTWAACWPPYPELVPIKRSLSPPLSTNLKRIVDNLQKWTTIIPSLNESTKVLLESPYGTFESQSIVAIPAIGSNSTTETDIEPQNLRSTIQNFLRTTAHRNQRQIHDVMEQWYSVATTIGAFRPSNCQRDLFAGIEEQARLFNITIPSGLHNAKHAKNMLQSTQLSLSLSPLILLVPHNGATQSINSMNLFQFASSLGTKPEALQEIDKILWHALLKLACGKDHKDIVTTLHDYSQRLQCDESVPRDWFIIENEQTVSQLQKDNDLALVGPSAPATSTDRVCQKDHAHGEYCQGTVERREGDEQGSDYAKTGAALMNNCQNDDLGDTDDDPWKDDNLRGEQSHRNEGEDPLPGRVLQIDQESAAASLTKDGNMEQDQGNDIDGAPGRENHSGAIDDCIDKEMVASSFVKDVNGGEDQTQDITEGGLATSPRDKDSAAAMEAKGKEAVTRKREDAEQRDKDDEDDEDEGQRKQEEEEKAREEAKKRREEEARNREDEKVREQEQEQEQEEAKKRREQEQENKKRREEEARKRGDEKAREQAKKREQEQVGEEAKKRREEEARNREDEKVREQAKKREQAREEAKKRREEEEENKKRREEEARNREDEKAREQAKKREQEQEQAREEAKKRREEEARNREDEKKDKVGGVGGKDAVKRKREASEDAKKREQAKKRKQKQKQDDNEDEDEDEDEDKERGGGENNVLGTEPYPIPADLSGTRDHPIYVDLLGDDMVPNTLKDRKDGLLSEETLTFNAYPPDPDSQPIQIEFQTAAAITEKEFDVLQEVQESVEHGYIDGRPPHHHPSAREKTFDPSHPPHSSIFVTDYQDFVKMSDMEVQLIFRDRHILVLNTPLSDEGFSLKTLKKFCNIKKMVDILDMSLKAPLHGDKVTDEEKVFHVQGSMEEFYEEAMKPDNGLILNALDIPLGQEYRQYLPYEYLYSHSFAWQQTRGAPGFYADSRIPLDHLLWATAAFRNATSFLHIDANGLATAIDQVTGTKYWVLARQRCKQSQAGNSGNMSSMHAFADTEIDEGCSEVFEHEAVLIQPGTVLFMRPNTPHYVLTVDNSITLGRHFYSSATIRQSCWGHLHSGLLGLSVTNTNHPEAEILLQRMFVMAITDYLEGNFEKTEKTAHTMDPMSMGGLVDIITLGNLLELCWVYDERTYTKGGIPQVEIKQRRTITSMFQFFKDRFQAQQRLLVEGSHVEPMTGLFRPSILQLAVQIYKYKQREDTRRQPFSAQQLGQILVAHFRELHPELVKELQKDMGKAEEDLEYCLTFDWTGPEFTVISIAENLARADDPMADTYAPPSLTSTSKRSAPDDGEDHEPKKRAKSLR